MFVLGKEYTREEIHDLLGGNKQATLPVHRGKVVAACLSPDHNPQAPDYIICNSGGAMRATGKTLAQQTDPVPVFIKQTVDKWRYVGRYVATASLTTPNDCAPHAKGTGFTAGQISRVLKMTPAH